jgi:hypothetical protein
MNMKKAKEIWKEIKDSPGYEVSSYGRVRNVDRKIKVLLKGKEHFYFRKGKILKSSINNSGYGTVYLGRYRKDMTHRVVAEVFLGKPSSGMAVNHKNGIRSDNRVENLEWVTYYQNTIYSRITFRTKGRSLNIDKALDIIKRAHLGERVKDLSIEYKVSRQCISKILSGRMWPSRSYPEVALARKKFPYVSPKFGIKWIVS